MPDSLDVLFVNGEVVDGTGRDAVSADLGVRGGLITYIGDGPRPPARRLVDAAGHVVCPGFIDMHAHSEIPLMVDPHHEPKVTQGVTTEVLGQDGLSYAPVPDSTVLAHVRQQVAGWNGDGSELDWSWRSVDELLGRLDHRAINVAYLVPHGTVRLGVMGAERRAPTAGELLAMCGVVEQGMEEGAFGISTGLTYAPAMYAHTGELVELCRVVAARGGYFSPHHRNYGASTFGAYAECLDIAQRSGIALHLTHAMVNREPNRGRAPELLAMIEGARAAGIDVSLDTYPYVAGCTYLHALLPGWAQVGGPVATLDRLGDPDERGRIRADIEIHGSDGNHGCVVDWSSIVLSSVGGDYSALVGMSVADAAKGCGTDPFELFVSILRADRLTSTCLMFAGDEDNVRTMMKDRYHMGGSDSILVGDRPHPRGWGTFPRFLGHYGRKLGLFSFEECVRKFTSLPARRLKLTDRGTIKEGLAADVVCLDPHTVEDVATFDDPRQTAIGIPHVMVNGRFVVEGGELTGDLPGRALRFTG